MDGLIAAVQLSWHEVAREEGRGEGNALQLCVPIERP